MGKCMSTVTLLFGTGNQAKTKTGKYYYDLAEDELEQFAVEDGVLRFLEKILEEKTMLFIEYPKCSTCKKAKAWMDERGIAYMDRHIAEENPSYEELKEWYKKSGLPLKRFFNTSGNLYKELRLKDKLPSMSEEEQLQLLASDGMLVKRPLIVDGDTVMTGFREAEWEEKLG